MEKKLDLLALGEVLMRLSPVQNERLTQCAALEKQLAERN